MVVFITRRLILRPLTLKDYSNWKTAHERLKPAQNIWDTDPSVNLSLTSYKQHLKQIKKAAQEDRSYRYGIFLKSTNEYIGNFAIMGVQRGVSQFAYLGYSLLNTHWGHGYAEEAVRKSFKIAFEFHELHRLQIGIEPNNKKSLKLAKKLKLRKEGLSKRVVYLRGRWQDIVQFAVTGEEVGIPYSANNLPQAHN